MNQIISTTQKALRFFTVAATLLITTTSLTARAGEHDKHGPGEKHNTGSASTAEVKYIGSLEGQPLFNVLYNNSTGARFTLKVLDGEGNQIFQGSYTDKKFDKKFKLADGEANSKLVFVVRNYEDNSVQTFEINSNTRLVEDIEVREVK